MRRTIDFYNDQVSQVAKERTEPETSTISSTTTKRKSAGAEDLKRDFERGRLAEFPFANFGRPLPAIHGANIYLRPQVHERRGYLIPLCFRHEQNRESCHLRHTLWLANPFCSYWSHVSLHPLRRSGSSQVFPFYTYAEDGTHRRENITDWALEHSAPTTTTPPSPSGTFSTTSTPSCTTPSTESATPPTSAANSPASPFASTWKPKPSPSP